MKAFFRKRSVRIVLIIVLLAILLGFFFYHQHDSQSQDSQIGQTESLDYKLNHLSMKDATSLMITYAHIKYRKNKTWKAVYQRALHGVATVKRYHKYSFGSYTVEANGGAKYVYIIAKKAAFTMTHQDQKAKAVFEIGDNHHVLGATKLRTVYLVVWKDAKLRRAYEEVRDGVDMPTSTSEQDTSSQSESSSNNSSAQQSASSSRLPGDGGLFDVPSAMQGTWYTADNDDDSSMTITAHTIQYSDDDDGPAELHKWDSSYDTNPNYWSDSYRQATKHWWQASWTNKNGINFIRTFTWGQVASVPSFFGLHTEEGQPVIVVALGADAENSSVYWKSQALAEKYADQKFSDLPYAAEDNDTDDDDD